MTTATGSRARRGRFRRTALALLAAATGSLVALALGAPAAHAAAPVAMPPVSLPADESPHPSAGMEWWYITGHLSGKDLLGKTHSYGYEVMIDRNDGLNTAPSSVIYNANIAVTDLTRGTYKMNRDIYSIASDNVPSGGGFSVDAGGVHIDGKNGVNHFNYGFADLSYVLSGFTATQSLPLALHGTQGVIPYGPWGTSGYYSETNLSVSGTLWDHGIPVSVTGNGWMDHQWGNWSPGQGGWQWYAIQLSNHTQYMLYFIHDANGVPDQTLGTLVNPDGSTVNLQPSSLGFSVNRTWTSPNTGNTYNVATTVTVPGGTLTVNGQLDNQEVWSSLIPQGPYWEGASTVSGTVNGASVTGVAYAEDLPFIDMPGHGYVWSSVLAALGLN
jgi:predicted secreted hydrolase